MVGLGDVGGLFFRLGLTGSFPGPVVEVGTFKVLYPGGDLWQWRGVWSPYQGAVVGHLHRGGRESFDARVEGGGAFRLSLVSRIPVALRWSGRFLRGLALVGGDGFRRPIAGVAGGGLLGLVGGRVLRLGWVRGVRRLGDGAFLLGT
jgi:hypothetical protein